MSGMSLLIDNVRLWDGTGSATQPRMAIEVQAGRIAWVGPASDWPGRRAEVEIVDGMARTLIPGLIDCHVHYSSPGGPDWIARFTDPPPRSPCGRWSWPERACAAASPAPATSARLTD